MFDVQKFRQEFYDQGLAIVEGVLDAEFVARAKEELVQAIQKEIEYHQSRDYSDFGMVLLCSLYGGTFIELFDNERLTAPFNAILGEGCIVYAFTSSSLPPRGVNYSTRIHVDCPRIVPGYVTNMGATICLDDFTEENGATYFLPHSQETAEAPEPDDFYSRSKRLIAPAGSACFFNARVWHSSAPNKTDQWRHGLTINMCRSYMKQRIDIPRAMDHMDLSGVSETALQKLGFRAQVPASYDEYYLPPEQRKFRQKAE